MNKQALMLVILTLIAAIFLSGSLSNLILESGQKYVFSNQKKTSVPLSVISTRDFGQPLSEIPIWIVLILGGLILLVSFIRLIKEISWKAIAWIILFSGFFSIIIAFLKPFFIENRFITIPTVSIYQKIPIIDPQFNIVLPLWLIVLLTSLGMVIILIIFWVLIKLKKDQGGQKEPFFLIALDAEETANTLLNGGEYRVSIIHCYQKMCKTIAIYLNHDRDKSITAREFITFLEEFGLNSEYIHRLTSLFEKARYSESEPMQSEKVEAIICLKYI
ncbi:DUF4129 domain-containing protein, partial [bacterium]|nr:DUF4129 domain-containing protein [bacterium]